MVFNLESWAFLVAKLVKNWPAMQETPVQVLGQQDLWRRDRLPTPVFLGFPGGSDSKEFICNVGDLGSIPGLGRFAGGGHGNPLQYSCLENPMDRSLVGYSPWGHKRVGQDWATKPTQHGELRKYHHCLTGILSPPQRNPIFVRSHSPSPLTTWPLAMRIYLLSQKICLFWHFMFMSHTCDLLCPALFTWHNVFKVHSWYIGVYQYFIPFYGQIIFCCVDFIDLFIISWIFRFFPPFAYYE